MKTLAITFFSAIAIIGVAMFFDMMSVRDNVSEDCLIGKTILTRDAAGRVTSELTIAINGKEWQETSMKQLSYYDNKTEIVTYNKVDGSWSAASKVVSAIVNGEPVSSTYYSATADGKWLAVAEQKEDDLSNSDVVDDLVFDADGNLIMKATYLYKGDSKIGLQKEEYGYEGSTEKTRVFYAWGENHWNKTLSSRIVVE